MLGSEGPKMKKTRSQWRQRLMYIPSCGVIQATPNKGLWEQKEVAGISAEQLEWGLQRKGGTYW